MTTKKKDTSEKKKNIFQRVLGEVADNVKEGATFVGEKVAETSAKAYVASTEFVADTSDKIHDFTEKQGLHKEEKQIHERQQTIKFAFGEQTLAHYLKNGSLHKQFLTTQAVNDLVEEFKSNEKRLKSIDKEIKKLENH